MTNGWVDIKNTDMMLIMGGNPAECHPCGFKWVLEAKRNRNAKLIVVDPRFTRTASTSDLFCQIRAGSDIAFLGGLIRYAIENNRYAKEYLVNYTNAAYIIKDGFKLPEDGLYSGFDPEKKTYDKSTWNYQEGGDMAGKPAVAAAVPVPSHAPHVNSPKFSEPGSPEPGLLLVSAKSGSGNGHSGQAEHQAGRGYQAASPAGAKVPGAPSSCPGT